MKTDSKMVRLLVFIMLVFPFTATAQCDADIQYTIGPQSLYNFTYSTSSTDSIKTITWYFRSDYVSDMSHDASPSYYLNVNGTYYVTLELGFETCWGYHFDTIEITGLTPSGACNADFSYYPTNGSQFQFADQSTSSDSIISQFWYGATRDSFIQTNGLGLPDPVMSLWDYNCQYDYFVVTHAITTVSGCQSVKVDTIGTYCSSCIGGLQAGYSYTYDWATRTYSFTDASLNNERAGHWYWQISLSDDSLITSTLQNPVVVDPPLPVKRLCLEIYDTLYNCRKSICDSLDNVMGVNAIQTTPSKWYLKPVQQSETQLLVNSNVKGELQFSVYDITGRCVMSKTVYNDGGSFNVETLVWSPGVYITTVEKGDIRLSAKLALGWH